MRFLHFLILCSLFRRERLQIPVVTRRRKRGLRRECMMPTLKASVSLFSRALAIAVLSLGAACLPAAEFRIVGAKMGES